MVGITTSNNLIRVICEGCSKKTDVNCVLCKGSRFYLWDPRTCVCYSLSGHPITTTDETGETYSVIRNHIYEGSDAVPEIQTMLDFIELWVSESPVRKWKLSMDENGWAACVWFNRYKKICFETADINLEGCIFRTYQEIIKNKNRTQST